MRSTQPDLQESIEAAGAQGAMAWQEDRVNKEPGIPDIGMEAGLPHL